jgi:SAM-dependent methyltransferase
MIDYANNKVEYQGEKPQYSILDVANDDLPFSAESVDLVSMVAVMHVLSEPLPVLEKIQKVLKPGGVFLLQDWIRTSLPQYLERMAGNVPPEQMEATRSAMFKLFPSHNKYTTDDWLWVLEQGGFRVVEHKQLRSPHFARSFVPARAETYVSGKFVFNPRKPVACIKVVITRQVTSTCHSPPHSHYRRGVIYCNF